MTSLVERCPGCGHPAGRGACQAIFDDVALRVRTLAWTDSLKTWRLMHDVHFVQHEEQFCGTYPRLVLHLGGICWALEHGGNERGYRALHQFVERNPWQSETYPPSPGIPAARGSITVASLAEKSDPALLIAGVDRWARSTWLAFAPLQTMAREWVKDALMLSPLNKK